jgi:hypothetical protein
VEELEVAEE